MLRAWSCRYPADEAHTSTFTSTYEYTENGPLTFYSLPYTSYSVPLVEPSLIYLALSNMSAQTVVASELL